MTLTIEMIEDYYAKGGTSQAAGAPPDLTAAELLAWWYAAIHAIQQAALEWIENWITAHGGQG